MPAAPSEAGWKPAICRSLLWGLLCVALMPVRAQDLITCGWDAVHGVRLTGTNMTTLWTWTAANSNLPDDLKPLFSTTDECKPCPGGRVLVTSSGGDSLNGAVALIEAGTTNVLFYARGPNAHSAELLPSNRVAVALSYHANGNRLAVFDLAQPDTERFSTPLTGAHGVVWDESRQLLWGLGDSVIAAYRLTNWATLPQLVLASVTGLPGGGGHDLYPEPDSPHLLVATDQQVWLFHRDTRTFTQHPLLGDTPVVKGVCVHPDTGRIVYVQADGPWWSERLRFLAPDLMLHFPGEHFYKARWIPPAAPTLSITGTTTNTLVISWPARWTEFSLEQNTNLNPAGWAAPLETTEDDGTNKLLIVAPAPGPKFYRLIKAMP